MQRFRLHYYAVYFSREGFSLLAQTCCRQSLSHRAPTHTQASKHRAGGRRKYQLSLCRSSFSNAGRKQREKESAELINATSHLPQEEERRADLRRLSRCRAGTAPGPCICLSTNLRRGLTRMSNYGPQSLSCSQSTIRRTGGLDQ